MKYHFHAASDRFPADGSALLSASMKMLGKVDKKISVRYLARISSYFSYFFLLLDNLRTVAVLHIEGRVCKIQKSRGSQEAYCKQMNTIAPISTSAEPLAPYLIIQAVTWKPRADLGLPHLHHLHRSQPARHQ